MIKQQKEINSELEELKKKWERKIKREIKATLNAAKD